VNTFEIRGGGRVGRVTPLRVFGLRADTPRVPAVVPALDGTERGLDPRLRTAWTLAAAAVSVAAGSAGAVITLIADGPAWLVALFAVAGLVLAAVAAVGARLEWASYRYRVTDDAVEITHGVIVQTLSVLPHRRIQQIDVRRGPVERRLGLATLVLRSAAATTDATLPGLADADAVDLRAALLARAGLDDAV
jgi:membrane protein YdbS with pleckstrin-like domain